MPRHDDENEDDDRPRRQRREDDDYVPPAKKSNLGLILGIVGGILFLLVLCGGFGIYFASTRVGEAAERMQSSNNLKQIGLACHNYADVYEGFPTNSYDEQGRPLLSWRVHILPYIEQDNLYRQFKLDEPWDGPTNIRLLNQMPRIYGTAAERKGSVPMGTKTFYRGFSNPGAVFAKESTKKPKGGFGQNPMEKPFEHPITVGPFDIKDGTSNTILVIEAGDSVEWTKPEDLDASPGKPFPPVGGYRPKSDVINILLGDGSVRSVKKTWPESQWRAGISHSGNDFVTFD